ncbi:chymotrypsin inhibitor precursor-like protein [Dinothrombium tinctorium]|uniref:Chymotrypsin inhibitor-like protein n=1 Tax=Dinothrombium tinctorium TaxID=1965070 RepID=A0A3S3PU15_9ACAR|nr:chymotrypsin inhibitor precursor-like protein [Dinothrombium tinctorium]
MWHVRFIYFLSLFSKINYCPARCLNFIFIVALAFTLTSINEEACREAAKVTGPCKAAFRMYSYNRGSGTCEEFTYGGCGGTRNRFETFQECVQRCHKK